MHTPAMLGEPGMGVISRHSVFSFPVTRFLHVCPLQVRADAANLSTPHGVPTRATRFVPSREEGGDTACETAREHGSLDLWTMGEEGAEEAQGRQESGQHR